MKILDVNIGFTFEKKKLVHCTKVEKGSVLRKEGHIVHELANADGLNEFIRSDLGILKLEAYHN